MTKNIKMLALAALAAAGLASAAAAQQADRADQQPRSASSGRDGVMNHDQMMNDPQMRKQMADMMSHCGKMMRAMGNMDGMRMDATPKR